MKKPFAILTVIIFTIVALVGTRSIIANEISTSGVALGAMQDEIRKYKVENTLLKEEMLKYSSLLYISSAAAKQGFSESKSNFALKKALPIALGQ
ncbi:MAG: hypothetical protein A3A51_00950 [Candidatus Levybacteria bacterium RIFCSPLOWO2_01_FULL_39_10]|nr:MAG: hypothetical protein A3A51_00950 [Candidatus Levybacteria bacterium RIFCSPLOWO2_01_FULL_39_10]